MESFLRMGLYCLGLWILITYDGLNRVRRILVTLWIPQAS